MSRALLSAVLAIVPALGFGFQDPKSAPAPQTQQPQTQPGAPAQPPAAPGAVAPPQASVPTGSLPTAADPAKPAEPKPSPDATVPGAVPVDPKAYVIGPEDELTVSVWHAAELSGTVRVRSDGMITLPQIGEVKAAGLTPLGLGKVLAERLSATELNDPIVTVSLVGAHSKKYYLYGQVKAPGAHDLIVPTTALEAIMSAGGFAEFANQTDITIVRGDKRLKFNFKAVLAGKHLEQNVYLESGDMIVVK